MKRVIAAAALLIAAALPLAAQDLPPGKWWRQPQVARALDLTSQQQDRLDAVMRDATPELIDLKANVDKLAFALRSEIDRTQLNRAEIQALAARLNEARGRLFARELAMLVDMRGILSDAQWTKLRDRMETMRQRMRDQRPGSDGPPHGAPMAPGARRPQGRP